MDFKTFKRVLTAFVDTPANIDAVKGKLICEVRDDIIEADLITRDGELWIREHDDETRATSWILNRVARLPLLAERILMAVDQQDSFISPNAYLSDQLDESGDTEKLVEGGACPLTLDMLNRRPVGSSSVVYLTSDAGEGKTTLINQLSRIQAEKFKKRETDWLMVPIALGGRPFLRFDDLVVGFMSNRLRFPMFYFDGFMELVKLGVIVPAFDGFEEMFVLSASGDALSAVGNLMRTLDSSGTVLIAARKAYFDYQDIRMQARLFDSIGTCSVAFSRVSLKRWEKPQFLAYCDKRCISNGPIVHNQVAQRLKDAHHPLLTRAVLVKKLLQVAESDGGIEELLLQLGNSPTDYFAVFVKAILEREAHEKWIDASGEAAKPLLNVEEHVELLASIAQEMWLLSTESLKVDVLDAIAELFCDARKLSAALASQIKERTKQHALLVGTKGIQQSFAFDHEEFRNFFLGEAVGKLCAYMYPNSRVELLTLLRKASLPLQAAEAAVSTIRRANKIKPEEVAKFMQVIADMDGPSSFTQENIARLILKVLHNAKLEQYVLKGLNFGEDALLDLDLSGIIFIDCSFATVDRVSLKNCKFDNCHFDRLNLNKKSVIVSCEIVGGDINCVQPLDKDEAIYVPALIPHLLRAAGFKMSGLTIEQTVPSEIPENVNLKMFRKLIRGFRQKTYMNENVVLRKLGPGAENFIRDEIPVLIKASLLTKERNVRDSQDRYHLIASMERIEDVLRKSPKSINEFIADFSSGNK